MTSGLDPAWAEAIAIGKRNAESIERFERFCLNVSVEAHSGGGMVEQQSGLPVGMRSFRCPHAANPSSMGMNLEEVAIEYFEANCRGCAQRRPSVLLGETIEMVADARQAARAAQRQAADDETAAKAAKQAERSRQRARRRAGEQYPAIEQLERIDRLDSADGVADRGDLDWLVRTARLAPEVVADRAVEELAALGGDPEVQWAAREAAQSVLVPLVAAGRLAKADALTIALGNLSEAGGAEAGNLLVSAGDALSAAQVTPAVVRSVVEIAGRRSDPWTRFASMLSGEPVVADPAPLRLCTDRSPDGVIEVIEQMLASARPRRPTGLVDLSGSPVTAGGAALDPKLADRQRSIAAGAAAGLVASESPPHLDRLLAALTSSLEVPDHDRYDAPPSDAIAGAIASGLRRQPAVVGPVLLATAPTMSSAARESLFKGVFRALRANSVPEEVELADEQILIQLVLDRLSGDWGSQVAFDAALCLDDLVRHRPSSLVDRAGELVGLLVVKVTEAHQPPAITTTGDPVLAALERMHLQQVRDTIVDKLRGAVGSLIVAGATGVVDEVFMLLDGDDVPGDPGIDTRATATRLLGKIGALPSRLPEVVPRLYTALLHREGRVRAAAVRSWSDLVGGPLPLPSTLLDLLPDLLLDGATTPALVRLIPRLSLSPERRATLTPIVEKIALGLDRSGIDGVETLLESCLDALWTLAIGLPDNEAESPLSVALIASSRLEPHDLRDLVTWPWPERLANCRLLAERALAVLVSPELVDRFNERDSDVQVVLLGCPYGVGLLPLEDFRPVLELHLPDHPLPAIEVIEVLQRAGRWREAATIASEIVAAIPDDVESGPRRELAGTVALLAETEAAASEGVAAADPNLAVNRSLPPSLSNHITRVLARSDACGVLGMLATPQSATAAGGFAVKLNQSATVISASFDNRDDLVTTRAWRAWAELLVLQAHVLRWDAAVQAAEADADRHLAAARRGAEVLWASITQHSKDPLFAPIRDAIGRLYGLTGAAEIGATASAIAAVPLPLRTISGSRRRRWSEQVPDEKDDALLSTAVGVSRLDGALVTGVQVLRPNVAHQLGLELRLTGWPVAADAIEATFLSVLGDDEVRLPSFRFPRAVPDDDGVYRLSANGSLSISFSLPAGAPPQSFPILARFVGPALDEVIPVAGHAELRIRPFDASTDSLTRRPQLDERIVKMYAVLHEMDVAADDVQAFCRLYTAIVDKVCDLQFDTTYRRGASVTERTFHNDLFDRILADPELGGRVTRGNRAAGGFLDIKHDNVNAELKVARSGVTTVETSLKYLGQPADYAADLGSQLSILVVLDMSRKEAPPGVLENYLGWMHPALIGLEEPEYPSLVGVIIVNANLVRPSGYSRGSGVDAKPVPTPPPPPDDDEAV